MLESDVEVLCHVEKRFRFAVMGIRELPVFEFDGLRFAVDDEQGCARAQHAVERGADLLGDAEIVQ